VTASGTVTAVVVVPAWRAGREAAVASSAARKGPDVRGLQRDPRQPRTGVVVPDLHRPVVRQQQAAPPGERPQRTPDAERVKKGLGCRPPRRCQRRPVPEEFRPHARIDEHDSAACPHCGQREGERGRTGPDRKKQSLPRPEAVIPQARGGRLDPGGKVPVGDGLARPAAAFAGRCDGRVVRVFGRGVIDGRNEVLFTVRLHGSAPRLCSAE
jgi:hypothetical protein